MRRVTRLLPLPGSMSDYEAGKDVSQWLGEVEDAAVVEQHRESCRR